MQRSDFKRIPQNSKAEAQTQCPDCGAIPSVRKSTKDGVTLWVIRDYNCIGNCQQAWARMREAYLGNS